MTPQEVEQEIRNVLATESSAITLSDKLFSPAGLFSLLATTFEERKVLVVSPLFKEAQQRLRELQRQELAAFDAALTQMPTGYAVKIERPASTRTSKQLD
jgi:hypothetical protein